MSVHRIRLHGPWLIRPHLPDVPPGRMTIPATLHDGGFADYAGRVSLHRHFGRPTNLDAQEQVWLVFEELISLEAILLNGKQLSKPNTPIEFDITGDLQDRNEVEVVLNATNDRCGILGNVQLEIRSE